MRYILCLYNIQNQTSLLRRSAVHCSNRRDEANSRKAPDLHNLIISLSTLTNSLPKINIWELIQCSIQMFKLTYNNNTWWNVPSSPLAALAAEVIAIKSGGIELGRYYYNYWAVQTAPHYFLIASFIRTSESRLISSKSKMWLLFACRKGYETDSAFDRVHKQMLELRIKTGGTQRKQTAATRAWLGCFALGSGITVHGVSFYLVISGRYGVHAYDYLDCEMLWDYVASSTG